MKGPDVLSNSPCSFVDRRYILFDVSPVMSVTEQRSLMEFSPGPLLLKLGRCIILTSRARGDYSWIGQGSSLSFCLLVARIHTWYKTAKEGSESAYGNIVCISFV